MITVAPGLGLGVEKNNPMLRELMEIYQNSHFILEDGTLCLKNIVEITTEFLLDKGLKNTAEIQQCYGFTIYPKEFFCPIDYQTRELRVTENTRTIHHYAESWVPKSTRFKNAIGRLFGNRFLQGLIWVKRFLKG